MPSFIEDTLAGRGIESGTVIVLNGVDRLTPGYVKIKAFNSNLAEHLGLVYRGFMPDCQIFVNVEKVEVIDPLFLNPNGHFYQIRANNLKAQEQEPLDFEFETADGKRSGVIRLRFSYLPYRFQGTQKIEKRIRNSRAVLKS